MQRISRTYIHKRGATRPVNTSRVASTPKTGRRAKNMFAHLEAKKQQRMTSSDDKAFSEKRWKGKGVKRALEPSMQGLDLHVPEKYEQAQKNLRGGEAMPQVPLGSTMDMS